jgi:hypothetical protein
MDEEHKDEMSFVRRELIAPITEHRPDEMLKFWRWLVPQTLGPMVVTALGDMFLLDGDGKMHWLDVGAGTLTCTNCFFHQFIHVKSDSETGELWYLPDLVDRLIASGKTLGDDQCYSFIQLPILGGKFEVDNFRVCTAIEHFATWGPIHELLKDVRDGETIQFVIGSNSPSP